MYVIQVCCLFSFCIMIISFFDFILLFGECVFSSASTWIYLYLPAICLFWLTFVWFIFLVKLFDLRYVLCKFILLNSTYFVPLLDYVLLFSFSLYRGFHQSYWFLFPVWLKQILLLSRTFRKPCISHLCPERRYLWSTLYSMSVAELNMQIRGLSPSAVRIWTHEKK